MAKDQGVVQTAMRRRTPVKAPPSGPAAVVEERKKPNPFANPYKFLQEVRAEARKITWTSWKETWITSVMVGIMVVVTGVFFAGVDGLLHAAMTQILTFANAG
jgi:preprotein translocase subunit SecE